MSREGVDRIRWMELVDSFSCATRCATFAGPHRKRAEGISRRILTSSPARGRASPPQESIPRAGREASAHIRVEFGYFILDNRESVTAAPAESMSLARDAWPRTPA